MIYLVSLELLKHTVPLYRVSNLYLAMVSGLFGGWKWHYAILINYIKAIQLLPLYLSYSQKNHREEGEFIIPDHTSSYPSPSHTIILALGIGDRPVIRLIVLQCRRYMLAYSHRLGVPNRPVRPALGTAGLTRAFPETAWPDCGKPGFPKQIP